VRHGRHCLTDFDVETFVALQQSQQSRRIALMQLVAQHLERRGVGVERARRTPVALWQIVKFRICARTCTCSPRPIVDKAARGAQRAQRTGEHARQVFVESDPLLQMQMWQRQQLKIAPLVDPIGAREKSTWSSQWSTWRRLKRIVLKTSTFKEKRKKKKKIENFFWSTQS
jgi:hypothetical protein